MALTKSEKTATLEQLASALKGVDSAILFDYKGLNVPQVTELRRQVRAAKGQYRVVKNTLARRALKGTEFEPLSEFFQGTTAIAFTGTDPVALAKTLTTFAKTAPQLTDQGGGGAGADDPGRRGDRTGDSCRASPSCTRSCCSCSARRWSGSSRSSTRRRRRC